MKQQTTLEKQKFGKTITDSYFVIWLRDRLYPLLILLTKTKVQCKVELVNTCNSIPDKPIIYVANHQAFQDTPIVLRVTKRRSYILSGKQNLAFVDWVFFILNGTIWVDRKSKEDMSVSKDAILEYLQKNQSILWFPEGTWNLTPNQLMLPMKWGIIDVAMKSGAQIVPVMLEYDRENAKCFVRFAEPMIIKEEECKGEAIAMLRDSIAAMRWEFWERKGIFSRSDMDLDLEHKRMFYSIEEYPSIEWEYENSCIYHPYTKPEVAFAHLNKLIPCRKNAFLFRKR